MRSLTSVILTGKIISDYFYHIIMMRTNLSLKWIAVSLIATGLLLGGCGQFTAPISGEAAPPEVIGTPEPAPTASPTLTPSATSTPVPTSTQTPSPTPHPLSIELMRAGSYPGSDIQIEEQLPAGTNYERLRVSYQSEGLKIYALMTIPYGETPPGGWPAIVFNHGYIPPDVYQTTERYVAYVDGFARNGYIVLKPDYRGHGDSEGEARGAYGRPDYTIDVLNAVASVQRYPLADPQRIGMWGHSMGGHITLRVMVTTKTVKVGVIWAGVTASYPDMMFRWRATPPASISRSARGWRSEFIDAYGDPDANPAFWASISPIDYAADLSGPLQLHHGEEDESVPMVFSDLLYQAVQAAGKEVEYYTYPGNDHNLSQSFSVAMQRSIEFFDRYLK